MTPTNACLDAETLAAWVDGGLSRNDAAMAEAHVSSCPRCQAIAGLIVKTTPATVVDAPWWRRRAAWLVPVTVGVSSGWPVDDRADRPGAGPVSPPVTAQPATGADRLGADVEPAPASRHAGGPRRSAADPRRQRRAATKPAETKKERQRDERANAAADGGAAAPRRPPPPRPPRQPERVAAEQLARQSFAAAAAKQAVSPDGALHWRITDRGALERSTDGGTTWQAVNVGITATFTTVQAPEPRTAIVTTTDGRVSAPPTAGQPGSSSSRSERRRPVRRSFSEGGCKKSDPVRSKGEGGPQTPPKEQTWLRNLRRRWPLRPS